MLVQAIEVGMFADLTEAAFCEAAAAIVDIVRIIGEIAAASDEQATGMAQVDTAFAEIGKADQHNAFSEGIVKAAGRFKVRDSRLVRLFLQAQASCSARRALRPLSGSPADPGV